LNVVQFHILNGVKAGTRWVAGRLPVSIGRSSSDDLRLDEPGVWERHCRIELRADDHAAIVPAPDASTTVNGQPIQEAVLQNGDLIELGSIQLQFGLAPTIHGKLRFREGLTWFAFGLLAAAQLVLIYLLSAEV
jgi:pSer/pThr/pTyr-binding forkhead associated (FHA) protein